MKIHSFILSFILVGVLYSGELITNGDFEVWSSGVPTEWQPEDKVNIIQSDSIRYSGMYAVGLQTTGSENKGIYQDIPVQAGVSYTFTAYLHGISGTGNQGIGILITWYTSDGGYISATYPVYNTNTNTWEQVTLTATSPENAGIARIRIRCYANSAFGGYADLASFYPTDSPPQSFPPTIKNVTRDPQNPGAEENITVTAIITDDETITTSRLFYRVNFGSSTDVLPDSTVDSFFYFTIPGQNDGDLIEYYVYAIDNDNNSSTSDTFRVQVGNAVYYVYFQDDTLRKKLGKFIHEAQYSIDIAMYECFTDTIVDSLIAAWNRGVKVRVITDYSYIDRQGTQDLINAGIPVIHEGIGDNSTSHIMHHKFIVRDYRDGDPVNDWIWTGSFNASDYLHADNAIVIKSTELADAFEREFNQMWGSSTDTPDTNNARTGTNKTDVLPTHSFVVGGDSIWVYFSPQDNPIQYLVNLVNRAQSEIGYLIYSFTRDDLRDALISAFQRGVWVGGVHEDNASNPEYDSLYNAGVPVYWENLPSQWYSLHDKFMVVDKIFVETGSMNWSNNGTGYNDENVIIIKNPNIAQLYWQEFTERYTEAGGSLYVKEVKSPKTYIKAYPNPFYTVCYFNTQNLEIYDISGRLVKKLGSLSYWDGRDKDGRAVLPGIYFVKKPGKNQLVKVVKIR